MLMVINQEYFDKVKAFAERIGKLACLQEKLDYLANYACSEEAPNNTRCRIYRDFAPGSFEFVMDKWNKTKQDYVPWFNGGLIYHGPQDGWDGAKGPTLSITLTPTDGWSVHT